MPDLTTTIPDSVYELPADFDWEPQAVCDYINRHWETANCDEKCTLGDLAAGLYWYCSDWYSGQWSTEYSILSTQLDFSPGLCSDGPEESGQFVYDELVAHNQP
jgi:hypothetical protein